MDVYTRTWHFSSLPVKSKAGARRTPTIPALGRLKEEDCYEFKTSLGYKSKALGLKKQKYYTLSLSDPKYSP